MNSTKAYHKLKKKEDFALIVAKGFKKSAPADKHWMGEGIYFFVDPNGLKWAYMWPFARNLANSYSWEGILSIEVDCTQCLDLTDNDMREAVRGLVQVFKQKLIETGEKYSDGVAFAYMFRTEMFKDILGEIPSSIKADFDKALISFRDQNSNVFHTVSEHKTGDSAQIQLCVLDASVLDFKKLELYKKPPIL